MKGFELILPFLQPIAALIEDDGVTEIMVNATGRVYIEREGRLRPVPGLTIDPKSLRIGIQTSARLLGDDFSESKPYVDARLPDGRGRLAAVMPPASVGGITLTIRKYGAHFYTARELVDLGTLPEKVLTAIAEAIRNRHNIMISGGTGSGKTTLLNAFATLIPADERIIVIEQPSELQLERDDVVRWEAVREQPPYPAVSIRDLVRMALRHRPDRIIVGEVRGGEAFDLLQCLNTGHSGSLTTIHANAAAQALTRLASCVLMSGVDLPYAAIRASLADTIHYVLHIERDRESGRRVVRELVRVGHYHPEPDTFTLHHLYGAS